MKLQYGTYTHAVDEAAITITKRPEVSPRGYRIGTREVWSIRGVIQAATVAALKTALSDLESAYATNGQTIKLLEDGGTETQHKIDSANTLGGIIVTSFDYPAGDGAEYTTYRSYAISLEAIRTDQEAGDLDLLSFRETVRFIGTTGPRTIWVELLNGPPQQQIVNLFTTQKIVQSGQAVGYAAYPLALVPAPLFPSIELVDRRDVNLMGPEIAQRLNFRSFSVSWTYFFESGVPLSTLPNAR